MTPEPEEGPSSFEQTYSKEVVTKGGVAVDMLSEDDSTSGDSSEDDTEDGEDIVIPNRWYLKT